MGLGETPDMVFDDVFLSFRKINKTFEQNVNCGFFEHDPCPLLGQIHSFLPNADGLAQAQFSPLPPRSAN